MIVAAITDDALIAVNSIELLGIVYLAIAVSQLRGRIENIQGRLDERVRQLDHDANAH